MSKTNPELRVTTPLCVISYPALFEPKAMEEGKDKKYSVEMIFPEGTDLTKLKAAAKLAAEEKWGKKIPAKLKSPFRDGDVDREGKEEYAGKVFISARSKSKPRVIVGQEMRACENPEEVYGGCVCAVSVTAFAYDNSGNKGVSFYLNSVWKVRDGQRLGGSGGDPTEDFAGMDLDAEAFGSGEGEIPY